MNSVDDEDFDFHDQVSIQIDRRKLEKLVADGVIPPLEEIPIYELTQQCTCPDAEPDDNERCKTCFTKYKSERIG